MLVGITHHWRDTGTHRENPFCALCCPMICQKIMCCCVRCTVTYDPILCTQHWRLRPPENGTFYLQVTCPTGQGRPSIMCWRCSYRSWRGCQSNPPSRWLSLRVLRLATTTRIQHAAMHRNHRCFFWYNNTPALASVTNMLATSCNPAGGMGDHLPDRLSSTWSQGHQRLRLLLAPFQHVDEWHLYNNMASLLWKVRRAMSTCDTVTSSFLGKPTRTSRGLIGLCLAHTRTPGHHTSHLPGHCCCSRSPAACTGRVGPVPHNLRCWFLRNTICLQGLLHKHAMLQTQHQKLSHYSTVRWCCSIPLRDGRFLWAYHSQARCAKRFRVRIPRQQQQQQCIHGKFLPTLQNRSTLPLWENDALPPKKPYEIPKTSFPLNSTSRGSSCSTHSCSTPTHHWSAMSQESLLACSTAMAHAACCKPSCTDHCPLPLRHTTQRNHDVMYTYRSVVVGGM